MLKGKVAVVTGSTSGIGLGIARQLAAAGADLMINGFGEPAAVEALLVELEAQGVFCRRVNVDVASHSPQVDGLRRPLRIAPEAAHASVPVLV